MAKDEISDLDQNIKKDEINKEKYTDCSLNDDCKSVSETSERSFVEKCKIF